MSSRIRAVCSTTRATGSDENVDGTSGSSLADDSSKPSANKSSGSSDGTILTSDCGAVEILEIGDIGASLNHNSWSNEEINSLTDDSDKKLCS